MINQIFSQPCSIVTTFKRTKYQAKLDLDTSPAGNINFEKLKAEIATLRVLAHYDVTADTKISADVSPVPNW